MSHRGSLKFKETTLCMKIGIKTLKLKRFLFLIVYFCKLALASMDLNQNIKLFSILWHLLDIGD